MDYCPNPECKAQLDRQYHRQNCAACGSPIGAPNVRAAQRPEEVAALNIRYDAAIEAANRRGANTARADLESVLQTSKAVINIDQRMLSHLLDEPEAPFSTYGKLVQAEARGPAAEQDHIDRTTAETILFPGYAGEIRYAALSLDDRGLRSYGPFSTVLGEQFIRRRATVLDENSYFFLKSHAVPAIGAGAHVPRGYRADWANRSRVAVAKLAGRLDTGTKPAAFPKLLLSSNGNRHEDDFIEVHIYGSLTSRAIAKVVLPRSLPSKRGKTRAAKADLREIADRLDEQGKAWEWE